MSEVSENAIKEVITGLIDFGTGERAASAEKLLQLSEVAQYLEYLKNGQVEEYDLLFQYKVRNALEGLVEQHVQNRTARFMVLNYEFVSSHVGSLVQKMEGSACSGDKESTILRRAFQYFEHQKPIVFNYDAKVTYHLPKKVLNTQQRIENFILGLERLFWGDPKDYLVSLKLEYGKEAA